ncbi:MAG: cupin domain-containing protein [Bacilli bacterium]|nr:cupin domain-containing protein [Bacilli bacterium]MDD4406563.1 cupin domain-containing protein [Bacilli bacterium]
MFNYAKIKNNNDFGPSPFVVDIDKTSLENNFFRSALWTGRNLQLTLMNIPVGGEIGLETHPTVDQFLKIEEGQGLVIMGNKENNFNIKEHIYKGFAIFIPANTWHNLINTGTKPIKLYSIYAPPNHPHGTVHITKEIADMTENH